MKPICRSCSPIAIACILACLFGHSNWVLAETLDIETSREEIRQADLLFNDAVAKRDLDSFTDLLEPNAVFLGGGRAEGRSEVLARWAPLFAADRSATLSWAPERVEIAASGDLGYTIGTFTLESSLPEGGMQRARGTYVTIWRRAPDGKWRAAVDAGTPPEPVPGE